MGLLLKKHEKIFARKEIITYLCPIKTRETDSTGRKTPLKKKGKEGNMQEALPNHIPSGKDS
ncbi:MAG: hypothetical protein K6C30_03330 [Bacteroidaceae bacterium]|nr:hypothetical protein [Bacteroidaceae bacterium]